MKEHKMKRQAGFTIIEMLIVVTILAMLAGILVPVLQEGQQTARDSRRMADLRSVQSALADYYREFGSYPNTSGAWQGDATDVGGLGYAATGYIPGLVPNHLTALPRDPDAQFPNATDGYMYRSDGTDYKFVLDGTPEDPASFAEGFPFYDPQRTDSWMITTPGAYTW
jgi:prepilin-type N-terminal cleavage/methylation domain-containing protein